MARRPKKNLYHIILVNHDKMKEDLFWTDSVATVNKEFKSMVEENKSVIFPIKFNNNKTEIIESSYEIMIIKARDKTESRETKVMDEYGKFVNYATNDDDWIIYDRSPYYIEETFWVYGYHPRLQRKDFKWIYDNFISNNSNNKYLFKTVQLFKNKILVECNGKLDMVICKNKQDSIRMYNMIEEWCERDKMKYIGFMGDLSYSKYKSDWITKIQKLTNWTRKKITRMSTRP